MAKISSSPDRHTFLKDCHIQEQLKKNEPVDLSYLEMWENIVLQEKEKINDPAWAENNLEYDLRTDETILKKVRESDSYAQNLYAALCNVDWRKRELWNELNDHTWHCSWRHAGGIIADMRQQGDYIDWYCSGIGSEKDPNDEETFEDNEGYVREGVVTEEIELDLNRLGWRPIF